jgi:hypothetical protein
VGGAHVVSLLAGLVAGYALHAGQSGEALDRCRDEMRGAVLTRSVDHDRYVRRLESCEEAIEACGQVLHRADAREDGCARFLRLP